METLTTLKMMNNSSEKSFFNLLRCEFQFVKSGLKNYQLLKIIKNNNYLKTKFVNKTLPHIIGEYPTIINKNPNTGKIMEIPCWDKIPNTVLLDWVFGIDFLVKVENKVIGIDVTERHQGLDYKRRKFNKYQEQWSELKVNSMVVCHWNPGKTVENLCQGLKKAASQKGVLIL